MAFEHVPVLLRESMELLAVRPGLTYVDGTVGLGGHAREILLRSAPDGSLLCVDRDPEALARAEGSLSGFAPRVRFAHADYREIPKLVEDQEQDGILLDLGVSSAQLDDAGRGFSFQLEGPLDMRMDRTQGETARDAILRLGQEELADVIYRFGEERASRRIARAIVDARERKDLLTTKDLASLVRRSSFPSKRRGFDPATRTFQALRIYVNRELDGLQEALGSIAGCLAPGGRLVVIAFHSLEDREVKQCFRALAQKGFLLLTKKPVRPNDEEVRENPRARSARMRAIERREAWEAAA